MENTFSPSWQREARDEMASVITSLEPDQLSAAKAEHHYPRRRLRRLEIVLFWALRIYLIFMFGVVLYQISKSVR